MRQVMPFDWFTTDHLVSGESTLHQVTGYELRVTLFSARSRIFLPIATQSCAALFCYRLAIGASSLGWLVGNEYLLFFHNESCVVLVSNHLCYQMLYKVGGYLLPFKITTVPWRVRRWWAKLCGPQSYSRSPSSDLHLPFPPSKYWTLPTEVTFVWLIRFCVSIENIELTLSTVSLVTLSMKAGVCSVKVTWTR